MALASRCGLRVPDTFEATALRQIRVPNEQAGRRCGSVQSAYLHNPVSRVASAVRPRSRWQSPAGVVTQSGLVQVWSAAACRIGIDHVFARVLVTRKKKGNHIDKMAI